MAVLAVSAPDRHRLADVVLAIEAEMRRAALWRDRPPAPAAMASRTPFCADTLAFPEWLQFVFLPRMHRAIEGEEAPPEASAIAPMGEESLAGNERLLRLLRAFDALIED